MIEAILLLGPTGAGKTPLGEVLERAGWDGRRCLHFDFGARLREAASEPARVPEFSADEHEMILRVLKEGALLEDSHFDVARKILLNFLWRKSAVSADLLILNGLPRHAGQARDLKAMTAVRRVILLAASPGTIRERIRTNAAGDRIERGDDSPVEIERKLVLFNERTKPLVFYYETLGVPIVRLDVGPETTAEELLGRLGSGL